MTKSEIDAGAALLEAAWTEQVTTMEQQASTVTNETNVRLVLGCCACPEQYDAFVGEERVGYLRLRHGNFTVECPDSGGTRVLSANPSGDGIFADDERHYYLKLAVAAILAHRSGQAIEETSTPLADRASPSPNVSYTMEPEILDDAS